MKMMQIVSYISGCILVLFICGSYWRTDNDRINDHSKLKTDYCTRDRATYKKIYDGDEYLTENQRKVDILHYDLFFDLFPEKKEFVASAVIQGVVKVKGLKSIDLNFYDNFEISNVKLNGKRIEFINEDKLLSVISDVSIHQDTFELRIDYSGTPQKAGFEGFVFGRINGTSVVYTISEPIYASSWFPCNDFPSDKALLDIRIKNDSSQVSVSNGILVSIDDDKTRRTYHWKTVYPISTYLVALYSSTYKHFSDNYISLDKRDTMSIDYYVLPESLDDAKVDFEQHPDIIKFFAETFGEYPFIKEKYGVAEFLWQMGAMENQTITGVASNIIGGRNFFLDIYIHELAHHWWGDAVGPKSWNDIWLNEGFSTYCEALYFEHQSGKSALQSTMLEINQGIRYGTLADPGAFLFSATVYNKGAWVLHMLRWEVGDAMFFDILREYYKEHKYSNASTQDFKVICESVSGKDLTKFFDQWIFGAGKIQLEYTWENGKVESGYETIIVIDQIQEEYEDYNFTLEIAIQNENGQLEYRNFDIDSKSVQLKIKSEQEPEDLILDPNNWLLMTADDITDY
jgi:aminopeptidase N